MLRQCAWCLRLINSEGDRLSPLPKPKLYEASHGICEICAMQCMEQLTLPGAPKYEQQNAIERCIDDINRGQQETIVSLRRPLQPGRSSHVIGTKKVSKTNVC